MCIDGVGHLVMNDETLQRLMSNPILDLVHKQVLMALYSMDANNRLHECLDLLPVYLSAEREYCEKILETLEQTGLVERTHEGVVLTHPIKRDDLAHSCGCH